MIKKSKEKSNKGITLIALVITIIVLLILATVSVGALTNESGVLKQSKKAAFKTKVAEYKERLQLNGFEQEDNSIEKIKWKLNKQIKALEKGIEDDTKTIEIIGTAESHICELHDYASKITENYEKTLNQGEDSEELKKLKKEIENLIQAWNNKVDEAKLEDGTPLLDGTFKHTVEFEQESKTIIIDNLNWEALYGSAEIDYNNTIEEEKKILEVLDKIFIQRSKLGAIQNMLDYGNAWSKSQKEKLNELYKNIFGVDGNLDEIQATKNAKSWNTTIKFEEMIVNTCKTLINGKLKRINKLIGYAIEDYNTDIDIASIQIEIDELIAEINRELKYTKAVEKSLLDGSFPEVEALNTEKLNIKDISVMNVEKAEEARSKVGAAITKLEALKTQAEAKIGELQGKATEEAEEGYAFEVDNSKAEYAIEIEEKDKNKFKIIDGELIYIGNNADEKQWAIEMEIETL